MTSGLRRRLCCLLTAAILAPATATGSDLPTKRQAKLRTFAALLAMTETRPDSIDATHAAITVGSCRGVGGGWRCNARLSPLLISGIISRCRYSVGIYSRRVDVKLTACD